MQMWVMSSTERHLETALFGDLDMAGGEGLSGRFIRFAMWLATERLGAKVQLLRGGRTTRILPRALFNLT